MPKVEYGITNCYYSVFKDGKYSAPVRLAGAVSFSDNIAVTDRTVNIGGKDVTVDYQYGSRTGELTVYYLPKSFIVNVLGYSESNGVMVEYDNKHSLPVKFSLLFETVTDGQPVRYVYFRCICKKPSFSVSTITEQANIEPRKLELAIQSRPCCGGVRAFVSEGDNEEAFNSWFDYI